MNTIYYFSGTGNSLTIARKLAERIPNTQVRNIASLSTHGSKDALSKGTLSGASDNDEHSSRPRIGFVFPTYAYGLPRMVKEFIETVPLPDDAYLFAVASTCGIPGPVLKQLHKILKRRGSDLDSGFTVLDPSSSLINDPDNDSIQKIMISASRGEKPGRSCDRIDEIAASVKEERRRDLETSNRRTNLLGGLLYPLALKSFKTAAKDFHTFDSCSGCGICVQVCPRNNISLKEGKPQWRDDCEMCHACIQWCPKSAIQYKELTTQKPRYRNPEVTLNDMIMQG
jgi:ferredoxin